MPTIAGRDQNGVDVLSIKQFTEVAIQSAVLISIVFVDQSLPCLSATRLNLCDRHTPHVWQTNIAFKSYVQRGPMPITPSVIRSLGETAPSFPRTRDGTIVGRANAALVATERRKNSRRVSRIR